MRIVEQLLPLLHVFIQDRGANKHIHTHIAFVDILFWKNTKLSVNFDISNLSSSGNIDTSWLLIYFYEYVNI